MWRGRFFYGMGAAENMVKPKTLAFLLIASAFTLTLTVSLVYAIPIGADIHFHYRVAQVWAEGGNGMFSPYVFEINKFPYPPLFHWLLVPSVRLGCEYEFARVLQVLFYPLTLASSMWVMWKTQGKQQALLTGMLLMSSMSLFDGCFQVKPQALDMILLPLVIYCFATGKTWQFTALSTVLVYSHGLAAFILLSGMLLYSLTENPRSKKFYFTTLLTLPILLVSIAYLPGAVNMWGPPSDTPQERTFWSSPLLFTATYLGSLVAGIPIAVYNVFRWHSLDKFTKTVMYTTAGLCLMLLPWADRYLQYIVIPFSFLTANYVTENRHKRLLIPLLIMVFAFYVVLPWFWLACDGYYINLGGLYK